MNLHEALLFARFAGGSTQASGVYVGTVTNGSTFPLTRLSGDPIQNEDFVKVLATSTFPFTIGSVTFTNPQDQAMFLNTGWVLNPGAVQETAETPVSSPVAESLSGTAANQAIINAQFASKIKEIDEEYQKAGFQATLTETDTNGRRVLNLTIKDKNDNEIINKNISGFITKDAKVAGIDMNDDITAAELEKALQECQAIYKNKTINVDNNTLTNVATPNFKTGVIVTSVTDSSTHQQIPTAKAVNDLKRTTDGSWKKATKDLVMELKDVNGNVVSTKTINLEDVLMTDHTQTVTNKTIDADNNTISNIETDNFKDGVVVTEVKDGVTDTQIPTAKSVAKAGWGIDAEYAASAKKLVIKLLNVYGVAAATKEVPLDNFIKNITWDKANDKLVLAFIDNTTADVELTDVVITDREQTLTNKSIDAADNTITNIGPDELKEQTADEEGQTFKVMADGKWTIGKIANYKEVSSLLTEAGDTETMYYLNTREGVNEEGLFIYNGSAFVSVGGGQCIKDVDTLPTEDVSQNAFYRIKKQSWELVNRYKLAAAAEAAGYQLMSDGVYNSTTSTMTSWNTVLEDLIAGGEQFGTILLEDGNGPAYRYMYGVLEKMCLNEPTETDKLELWCYRDTEWYKIYDSLSQGGGGGTSDYTLLLYKPQINNTELNGNRSGAQLGLLDLKRTESSEFSKFVVVNSTGNVIFQTPTMNTINFSIGANTSRTLGITWFGTKAMYNSITPKNRETIYMCTDSQEIFVDSKKIADANRLYEELTDKPKVNGVVVKGNMTSKDLKMYTIAEIDNLFASMRSIKVVKTIPNPPVANTMYYVGEKSPYHVWLYDSDCTAIDMGLSEVDLDDYQKIKDDDLETTAKSVVPAINELKDRIDDHDDELELKQPIEEPSLKTTATKIPAAINELYDRKVTVINESSDDAHVPSAKAVYDRTQSLGASTYVIHSTSDTTKLAADHAALRKLFTDGKMVQVKITGENYLYQVIYATADDVGLARFDTGLYKSKRTLGVAGYNITKDGAWSTSIGNLQPVNTTAVTSLDEASDVTVPSSKLVANYVKAKAGTPSITLPNNVTSGTLTDAQVDILAAHNLQTTVYRGNLVYTLEQIASNNMYFHHRTGATYVNTMVIDCDLKNKKWSVSSGTAQEYKDDNLTTTDKQIVGAINEVNAKKFATYQGTNIVGNSGNLTGTKYAGNCGTPKVGFTLYNIATTNALIVLARQTNVWLVYHTAWEWVTVRIAGSGSIPNPTYNSTKQELTFAAGDSYYNLSISCWILNG